MVAIQHILALIITVCITASTILGGFHKQEDLRSANTLESKVLKFEGPSEAILNITEKTLSSSTFFPHYFYERTDYKHNFHKSFIRAKEHLLVNPFSRNAFYVFISINAPPSLFLFIKKPFSLS